MTNMGGLTLSESAARQMISRAINVIVQLSRGTDGRRRLASITEITGMEGSTVTVQELFRFEQRGVDQEGRILGDYAFTGIRPRAMNAIERAGIVPAKLLESCLRRA
jgi:pilus assembly protein CpaF